MKKIIFLFSLMIGHLTAYADEYAYLTFETADGTKTSVSTQSLSLTISGSTLTAGSKSFALTNLSKMYFSTTDETGTADGIRQVSADTLDKAMEVYDLQGRKVEKDQLHSGVYIVKTEQGTYKIAVK